MGRKKKRVAASAIVVPPELPAYEPDCPCPKVKCERHNHCPECYVYHARKGKLPYCMRG